MSALAPVPSLSPAKATSGDVRRINRIRDTLGVDGMVDALSPLLTPEKRAPIRAIAHALKTPVSTAWKVVRSLPLEDVTNLAHAQQRALLRKAVVEPAACLVPSIRPANNQYLLNTEEDALVTLISERAINEASIGRSPVRRIAAEMRSMRLQREVAPPSKRWYQNFRNRHRDVFKQVRAEVKEFARADAERADEIKEWYAVLNGLYEKHKYKPHQIFAADESGLDGEAGSREKVLVPYNVARGYQIGGALRQHVSLLHICHAAGESLPPIFAFEGVWYQPALLNGTPAGARLVMQANGYFEKDPMLGIIEHMFVYMDSRPDLYKKRWSRKQRRTLLILDGAKTHIDAAAMTQAASRGMDVIVLPAHMTHIMQVADVAVFSPFKLRYTQQCDLWRHQHPGKLMSKHDIAGIASQAINAAMTKDNVISGFRITGQWPFDPDQVLDKVDTAALMHLRCMRRPLTS